MTAEWKELTTERYELRDGKRVLARTYQNDAGGWVVEAPANVDTGAEKPIYDNLVDARSAAEELVELGEE